MALLCAVRAHGQFDNQTYCGKQLCVILPKKHVLFGSSEETLAGVLSVHQNQRNFFEMILLLHNFITILCCENTKKLLYRNSITLKMPN